MPARKVTTMPTPPPFGVGSWCAFRSPGESISRAEIMMRTITADSRTRTKARPRWRTNAASVIRESDDKRKGGFVYRLRDHSTIPVGGNAARAWYPQPAEETAQVDS